MQEFEETLKRIVLGNSERAVDMEELTDLTDLVNDLALDSIAIVHLFADLEEEFRIEIDLTNLDKPILGRFEWLREYVAERIRLASQANSLVQTKT